MRSRDKFAAGQVGTRRTGDNMVDTPTCHMFGTILTYIVVHDSSIIAAYSRG